MTEETQMPEEQQAPAAAAPADPVLAGLAERFPGVEFEAASGHDVARVSPGEVEAFAVAARDAGYGYFADLCAVDHLHRRPERYEVVINLLDPTRPARLLIKVPLDAPDPEMPSIAGVFPGADFFEREAWDLFGIRFAGHPELTRILLPEDWEGHPLRKDVPVGTVPVQFKEADSQ